MTQATGSSCQLNQKILLALKLKPTKSWKTKIQFGDRSGIYLCHYYSWIHCGDFVKLSNTTKKGWRLPFRWLTFCHKKFHVCPMILCWYRKDSCWPLTNHWLFDKHFMGFLRLNWFLYLIRLILNRLLNGTLKLPIWLSLKANRNLLTYPLTSLNTVSVLPSTDLVPKLFLQKKHSSILDVLIRTVLLILFYSFYYISCFVANCWSNHKFMFWNLALKISFKWL